MTRKLSFSAILMIAVAAQIGFAQNHFVGKVVDIVDGKTFVLEAANGRVTGVLENIDVPEPEQPLYQTVCEHLKVLTLNRDADFQVLSLSPGKFVGRLTVDGVDISQQMLRDGAAWLIPAENTGQAKNEFAIYQESENAAKSDKLGVWSLPGLKPAWLIRAEREEKLRQELASKPKPKAKLDIVSPYQTVTRPDRLNLTNNRLAVFEKDAWMDVLAGTGNETPGIKSYTDPKGHFVSMYTSGAFVNFVYGPTKQRFECRVWHVDIQMPTGGRDVIYVLGLRAISEDYHFSPRTSRLSVTTDGKTTFIPLFHGFRARGQIGAEEIVYYLVNRALLQRISAAQNIQLHIDKFGGVMDRDLQSLISQLVAATE
jgi:endonuclease YncB( thermonuclease family)